MRQPRFLLAFALVALVGAGCNPQVPQSANDGQGAAEPEARLTGTWRLETLHGEAVDPSGGEATPTLTLAPDGKASGSGGCNQFGTTYERRDGEMSFGRIAATKMACPETMAMEREFFEALSETREYRIRDGRLELLDAQGAVLARLRPGEAPGSKGGN